MKGAVIAYSDKELGWIERHKAMPRREAHFLFCKTFGRGDVSLDNYKGLCTRNGWLTGRTGCYAKGDAPANKGKKMPYNANSARTRFQKGHLGGKAKDIQKPIGFERVTKDGYLERKINNDMPFKARWRAVHLINWEAVHGAVPKGYALKCLDGNRQNCTAENWVAVPRAMLPRLAGRWCTSYDDAPAELKPLILATARLKYKASQVGGVK